jgi:hypothetical protein
MEIYSHFIAKFQEFDYFKPQGNQNLTLVLRRNIFIGDKYNHFLPAQKKALKLFSAKR